jgi:glutathione peroxidase-family protein
MPSIHDFDMTSITGESVALSSYAGQVCLVVNVASK